MDLELDLRANSASITLQPCNLFLSWTLNCQVGLPRLRHRDVRMEGADGRASVCDTVKCHREVKP